MSIDQSLSDAKLQAQMILTGSVPGKVRSGSHQVATQFKADIDHLKRISERGENTGAAKLKKANELRNKIAAITSNYFSG